MEILEVDVYPNSTTILLEIIVGRTLLYMGSSDGLIH